MDTNTFQNAVKELIEFDDDELAIPTVELRQMIRRIQTYDEAGVMTCDLGLVVELHDGSIYHVTIQRTSSPVTSGEMSSFTEKPLS